MAEREATMERNAETLSEALEVLGNELRMDVIRELADADRPLSFTELRERVDVRDTGKFNYHLTRLCGYFVRETEGGYELGHAGTRLLSAVGPGGASEHDLRTGSETGACPVCGEAECEKLFHVHLTPPGT